MYKIYKKLDKRLNDQRRAINDGGKALTDTLRVAFDNMKQMTQKQSRMENSIKTINEKIQSIMFGKKAKEADQFARFRAAVESAKKQSSQMEENENE